MGLQNSLLRLIFGPHIIYKLVKQNYLMLNLRNRENQIFLVDYRHINSRVVDCCRLQQLFQDKTIRVQRKKSKQQKISLKTFGKQTKTTYGSTKVDRFSSNQPRNLKKIESKCELNDVFPPCFEMKINRIKSHSPAPSAPPAHTLIHNFKSQQNLHAFQPIYINNYLYKPLVFQYSTRQPQPELHSQLPEEFHQEEPYPQESYVPIFENKQIENIEQTTCLQLQSQQSYSLNFGFSTKIVSPPEEQQSPIEEEVNLNNEDQWSDESLSSQTRVRFEQIDEEESISDSASVHHRNMVTINHNHGQMFQDLRKAQSIRSNLSHCDDNYSGHSIVLDKDNFFLTPEIKHDRNEHYRYDFHDI